MPRTIIVSDLHADTWGSKQYGAGERRKTKLQHWSDFLQWCAGRSIDELVINGDLMDAPPYKGNKCFQTPTSREAIALLVAYARTHKVTYVYGNHDIGISGLRCAAGSSLDALANINLVYPDYVLKTRGSTVLIQHGHLFDPALLLYIKDLTLRTYIKSNFEAFQWVQQRWDPRADEKAAVPGVASPATVDFRLGRDNDVYGAILMTEEASPTPEAAMRSARTFINNLRRGVVSRAGLAAKHYLWWEAAKSVFEDYLDESSSTPSTLYCAMGHTHVPDTGEERRGNTTCIYLNSGTWTGAGDTAKDCQYAGYLDVRDDGKVWIQDWIHKPHLS